MGKTEEKVLLFVFSNPFGKKKLTNEQFMVSSRGKDMPPYGSS